MAKTKKWKQPFIAKRKPGSINIPRLISDDARKRSTQEAINTNIARRAVDGFIAVQPLGIDDFREMAKSLCHGPLLDRERSPTSVIGERERARYANRIAQSIERAEQEYVLPEEDFAFEEDFE